MVRITTCAGAGLTITCAVVDLENTCIIKHRLIYTLVACQAPRCTGFAGHTRIGATGARTLVDEEFIAAPLAFTPVINNALDAIAYCTAC